MQKILVAAAVIVMMGQSVQAKPHLREVKSIEADLLSLGVADIIRKNCSNITPQYVKALRFIHGVRDKARNMGYTDAEIDAYRNSDADKERLRTKGYAYLRANGVKTGQPQTYCALGRAEIEKSSQIGALLKVK